MPGPFHAVPVKTELSHAEFLHEHVLKRQPVLIKGALKDWRALRWTPESLKQKVGAKHIRYRSEGVDQDVVLGDMIDLIFNGPSDVPAPYLRNIDLRGQLPELAGDISPDPIYCGRNWRAHPLMPRDWPREVKKGLCEMFVSQANASFPYLHIDYWGMAGFLAQIVGEKEVILFPAEDAPHLYTTPEDPLVSTIKDFDNPDDATYPRFKEAQQYRVTLGPGDLLYNPAWWHTTKTLKTSITLIWAYWNRHEWDHLMQQVRRTGRRGLAIVWYLRFVGLCNRLAERRAGQ